MVGRQARSRLTIVPTLEQTDADRTGAPTNGPTPGRWAAAWAPVISWAALIFTLSAQPNLRFMEDAGLDIIVRKSGHLAAFGILAALLWWAFMRTTQVRPAWAWAMGVSVLYAISDEVHQGSVLGRHAAAVDVAIDATGAFAFLFAVRFLAMRRGLDA